MVNSVSEGPKRWGHAVSADLVHWEHLPIALSPTPGGPDEDGVWTGCAVLDDHCTPTIIYTGVRAAGRGRHAPAVQCLATSHDGLRTWRKHPANPVIAGPPEGMDVVGFRDPQVWREPDGWYQVVGAGIRGEGGAALLYRSPDLVSWEYLHPLATGVAAETGEMWECPDFFALGDRHVLLISALGQQLYLTGRYRDHRLSVEAQGALGYGRSYYAGKSFVDGLGRRILWGWLREERNGGAAEAAGWSGAMALPVALSMQPDGTVGAAPVDELTSLRGRHAGPRAARSRARRRPRAARGARGLPGGRGHRAADRRGALRARAAPLSRWRGADAGDLRPRRGYAHHRPRPRERQRARGEGPAHRPAAGGRRRAAAVAHLPRSLYHRGVRERRRLWRRPALP